jgi:hypothetical protein
VPSQKDRFEIADVLTEISVTRPIVFGGDNRPAEGAKSLLERVGHAQLIGGGRRDDRRGVGASLEHSVFGGSDALQFDVR